MERRRRDCQQSEPNIIKGLTPKKVTTFAGRSKTGRSAVVSKNLYNVCQEEPMFIRAQQGHSDKNLDVPTFY